MNGFFQPMFHIFLDPANKQQPVSVSLQPLYYLLSCPRPGTGSSQPWIIAWLYLETSKPSTSSSHLRRPYNSGRVAPGKAQVGADLGLPHSGNPRASTLSGQLHTMLEHHHPAPAQLILHIGQRLVVSGPSLSLQLTNLGKSLSLTCQQQ